MKIRGWGRGREFRNWILSNLCYTNTAHKSHCRLKPVSPHGLWGFGEEVGSWGVSVTVVHWQQSVKEPSLGKRSV